MTGKKAVFPLLPVLSCLKSSIGNLKAFAKREGGRFNKALPNGIIEK
jgi:hypothetical protein